MKKKTWLRILAGIGIYLLLLCGFWIAESRAAGSPSPSMTDSLSQTAADSSPTSSADSYAESSSVSSPEPASSAESSAASSPQAESEKITPGSAVWYSLVTLTTVGYGDIVPHTLPGKIIGGIFTICSTFFLAFVIGMMLSLWRGRLQPMIRLMKSKGKRWFIFQEDNIRTRTLGRNLLSEDPRNVIIFSGDTAESAGASLNTNEAEIYTGLSIKEILHYSADKTKCTVFFMGENGFENYHQAVQYVDQGVKLCCMTEYEPDHYPAWLTLFDPYISCARTYWNQYPVRFSGETIVLIGSGKYAEALLEQALMVNVFDPEQQIRYLVYGDYQEFRSNHYYLSAICSLSPAEPANTGGNPVRSSCSENNQASGPRTHDQLVFKDIAWNADADALKQADRIILCFDREEETLSAYNTLHKCVPTSARVYARLSHAFDQLTAFGSPDSLFSSENVLRKELDRDAIILHNLYLKQQGWSSPTWEELSAFLRRSNLASADHLPVKMRILLGEDIPPQASKDLFAKAFQKWKQEWPSKKDTFRWIEHERWLRFYLMYNWQYAEKRNDEKRLHTEIKTFNLLSGEAQAKDDNSWKMLGTLADNPV